MPQAEERGAGKGAAALCPASAHSAPGALLRSGIEDTTRPWVEPLARTGRYAKLPSRASVHQLHIKSSKWRRNIGR